MFIAAVIVAAFACTRRAHTRADFGMANKAAFDRQAEARSQGSAQGLDSEEAAAINHQYRGTLGERGQRHQDNSPGSSVLILQEGRRDAARRP